MNDIHVTYTGPVTDAPTIDLPVSKSVLARRLILAAEYGAPLIPPDNDWCDDLLRLHRALTEMTAGREVMDVGSSGTAMRFMTACLSSRPGTWRLTGSRQVLGRPMAPLLTALRSLGAEIETDTGGMTIKGVEMRGGIVEIDATASSQYVSALMLIAPRMKDGLVIRTLGKRASATYIYMTMRIMQQAGANIRMADDTISIAGGEIIPIPSPAERDWSAASYFFETVAITGTGCFVPGLHAGLQGDTRCLPLFRPLGVEYDKDTAYLYRTGRPVPPEIIADMSEVPDLVPAYAATLCALGVRFRLNGIGHLRFKESDRLTTVSSELRHAGYDVTAYDDRLEWDGRHIAATGDIFSHHDHRIAMAMAPLAFRAPLTVHDASAVEKSFPSYFHQLTKTGYTTE